jgi:cell division septation protein DedD
MKNTSILIPIILIGCLAALGFLFYKALQTVEEDRGRGNNSIVLNEADYAAEPTPTDLGATTDYDAAEATADTTDEGAKDGILARQEARERREEEDRLAEAAARARREEDDRIDSDTPATTSTASPGFDTATEPSGSGRYLVIAGSFRQSANAAQRVTALRRAGFTDTRMEKFNKGTFAVALAGQSDRFSEAERLAGKLIAAGFEAKVMRRR